MENVETKVERLLEIRARAAVLRAEEETLCRPDPMPKEALERAWAAMEPGPSHFADSQVFLYCWLLLYDPAALAGRKLRRGDRAPLARAIGVRSGPSVSMRVRDLAFLHRTYPSFRAQARSLLERAREEAEKLNDVKDVANSETNR